MANRYNVNLTLSAEVAKVLESTLNRNVILHGESRRAVKNEVVTILLGKVGDVSDVYGVIWRTVNNPNHTYVVNKENPEGTAYDDDWILVVRIIKGRVLINGMFDLYAVKPEKAEQLAKNKVNLEEYSTSEQMEELKPLLESTKSVTTVLTPKENRTAILITQDTVERFGNGEEIACYNEWNEVSSLVPGDVFIVTKFSESNGEYRGYRIGKEEFEGTHEFLKKAINF